MAQAASASKPVHVPVPPAPTAPEQKEKKARPAPAPISLAVSSGVAMDIDAKKPSRYFLQPILQNGKYYHWPALRVDKIANKGGEHGIRATTVLPANSILVYWGQCSIYLLPCFFTLTCPYHSLWTGIEISDQRYDRLLELRQKYPVKNASKRYIDYIAVSGRKGFMINANPRFCKHEHVGGYGLWIAGMCGCECDCTDPA